MCRLMMMMDEDIGKEKRGGGGNRDKFPDQKIRI